MGGETVFRRNNGKTQFTYSCKEQEVWRAIIAIRLEGTRHKKEKIS